MVIFPQVDNDSGKEELMYLCEYNPPIRERYENPAGCGCKWYTKNAEKTEGRRIFLKISVAFCVLIPARQPQFVQIKRSFRNDELVAPDLQV